MTHSKLWGHLQYNCLLCSGWLKELFDPDQTFLSKLRYKYKDLCSYVLTCFISRFWIIKLCHMNWSGNQVDHHQAQECCCEYDYANESVKFMRIGICTWHTSVYIYVTLKLEQSGFSSKLLTYKSQQISLTVFFIILNKWVCKKINYCENFIKLSFRNQASCFIAY